MEQSIHFYRRRIGFQNLRIGITFKMFFRSVVPTQRISCVSATPSIQSHSPRHSTVKKGRTFPDSVCGNG
ncbi:hypothetical protein COLO4_01102 [Corchorus olitorius]|uniref:Uncharacterized protein n=1 Tax=Corchorus olitorius TaxID=93759 RepID=A0A1R3L346_9ROSI|nr:hypothetical protein COLO4_01102 [Corchorus olitorius]